MERYNDTAIIYIMIAVGHIRFFIRQVEEQYNKTFASNTNAGHHIRPISMLITHRLTGLDMRMVAVLFKCDLGNVSYGINRQLGYEKINDTVFKHHYNELLQLFIDSTRLYIRKKRFIGSFRATSINS